MSNDKLRSIVLISLDTLRYDCVGACPQKTHLAAYGLESEVDTPNLDEFFGQSMYFTDCLSAAPLTTPSHASLLSGLWPAQHGARALFTWAVRPEVRMLAEELKERGYTTIAVLENGESNWMWAGSDVLRGFDELFTDEAEACRRIASGEGPFLVFLHTWDIHTPYCWSYIPEVRAHDEARRRAVEDVRRTLGIEGSDGDDNPDHMVFYRQAVRRARRELDGPEAVRLFLRWFVQGVNWFDRYRWPRIADALRGAGLWHNAFIAAFADHGEAVKPDSGGPPIKHIDTLLDDVLRVPLAIRAPGLEAGQVAGRVSLVDVAPTIMEYLGLPPDAVGTDGRTDGRSLLERAGGERPFFAEAWIWNKLLSPPRVRHDPDAEEMLQEIWSPAGACMMQGALKLLWHPGPLGLKRFRAPERALSPVALLKRAARTVLPERIVKAVHDLRVRRRKGRARASMPDPEALYGWRPAPMFMLDLNEDPLEMHPRRLKPARMAEEERAMLDRLRDYWQSGVLGPRIELESREEEERVLQNLKDLGYVD
ncbi:MAG: sulfatase-like hydrolase/transferase [Candidatus Brocadiia bacterium]